MAPGAAATPLPATPLLQAAAFCLIWASAFAAAKFGLADCPPLTLLALRFALAGAFVLGACALAGIRLPPARDLLVLAGLGVVNNALYLGLSFVGMQTVSSGLAAVVVSANPVLTAAAASLLLREGFSARRAAGLALGVAGVALVVRGRLGAGLDDPAGIAFVAAACASLVLGTILFKRLAPPHDLRLGNGVQCLAGAAALAPVALLLEDQGAIQPGPRLFGALAYLALVVSVLGFGLWYWLLDRAGAARASALHFAMPPLGLLFGWALLDEPVPPADLLGAVPVALGVWLVTREGARAPAARPAARSGAATRPT
jgi:drug/metabolite transporter (DMT)-like permease